MKKHKVSFILFFAGVLFSVIFAGLIGRGFYHNLRTLSAAELSHTAWNLSGPLFMLWALSITIGSILVSTAALLYVQIKKFWLWALGIGIGVFTLVVLMVIIWSRVYSTTLFGIGGIVIMLSFFALVWLWMKKYAPRSNEGKVAGSIKLIGYIFWINASWFLCGETGKMHLRAFAGQPAPVPIEIMTFLVLGWIFVMAGEYQELKLEKAINMSRL